MFLHPVMLAGLGGAAVPVVIHLLNAARAKNHRWGAMMFLPAQSASAARLMSRSTLLLMVRMTMVGCLSAALAEPVLGSGAGANADNRLAVVILFDNSLSMSFNEGTAGTRLETARSIALSLVHRLDRDDEVHFVPLAGGPKADSLTASEDTADLQTAISQIAAVQSIESPADIAAGLTEADRLLQHAAPRQKIILLIRSRSASGWRNVSDLFAAQFRERMLPFVGQFRLIDFPVGSDGDANVAIDRITLPPPPIALGQRFNIQVAVHNYGSASIRGLPIELRASGQSPETRLTVDCPAGSVKLLAVPLNYSTVGPRLLSARLNEGDRVPGNVSADDECFAVANVVEPIQLTFIGQHRPTTLPAELAIASLKQKADARLLDQLIDSAVVVLNDFSRLDDETVRLLKNFVFAGGGLLILPPAKASVGFDLGQLFEGGNGMCPALLGTSKPVVSSGPQLTSIGRRVLSPLPTIPPLSLPDIPNLRDTTTRGRDAQILADVGSDRPWLIARTFGRGHVILSAAPIAIEEPSVSTLANAILRYLDAGLATRCNLNAGDPIQVHLRGVPDGHSTVALPDGTHQEPTLTQNEFGATLRFAATKMTGRYFLTLRGRDRSADRTIPFVVRPNRDASDLTGFDGSRLIRTQQILGIQNADPHRPSEFDSIFARQTRFDLWMPMLLVTIAVGLIELWIADHS